MIKRIAAVAFALSPLLACSLLRGGAPPEGVFEGTVPIKVYRKATGRQNLENHQVKLAIEGKAAAFKMPWYACTGVPKRVNDKIVIDPIECSDAYAPGCKVS